MPPEEVEDDELDELEVELEDEALEPVDEEELELLDDELLDDELAVLSVLPPQALRANIRINTRHENRINFTQTPIERADIIIPPKKFYLLFPKPLTINAILVGF